jgi:hypothetical protein
MSRIVLGMPLRMPWRGPRLRVPVSAGASGAVVEVVARLALLAMVSPDDAAEASPL